MIPSLTWLDFTADDRNRMRRVLDLFTEQGTVDELGLGTLRDALSDALFPGTSTLQTRLRYLLFIPWIYQKLERDRAKAAEVQDRARRAELALINPLSNAEDNEGVIGARARGTLKILPSTVYWGAIVRWGLFVPAKSQSWYHSHFHGLVRGRTDLSPADDPGVIWTKQPTWHPRLPNAPPHFPEATSFDLSREEAHFLLDQITARCPGTLLAWLAAEGEDPTGSFWDEPAVENAPESIRATVELARRFSRHLEGAPLLYNLLLAEERHRGQREDTDAEQIDSYGGLLAAWAAAEADEEPFNPTELWSFVAGQGGRLIAPQQRFVEAWTRRVTEVGAVAVAGDQQVRNLVRDREIALKRDRSRFTNESRLLDWTGHSGVGRFDFRWFRVRQLLTDLHRGLEA